MPKEKNSADPAIWSAGNAARGSSIMVPIVYVELDAALLLDRGGDLVDLGPDDLELPDRSRPAGS